MKAQSYCCVCDSPRPFEPVLRFSDHPFPRYAGTVIGKCRACGMYKTIQKPKNFDPAQSRFEMYESDQKAFEAEFEPIVESVEKQVPKKGRVLDVGCSSGTLLRILQKEGYDVWGIEANKEAAAVAQKSLKKNVVEGVLSQSLNKLPMQFDCIVYNHVLEHIENPREELALALQLLSNNGALVVGVPSRDNWVAELRQERWESLMPGEHIWHFRTRDIVNILEDLGTKIEGISYSNHHRRDYPAMKRLFFSLLTSLNTLTGTGEATLIVATKK